MKKRQREIVDKLVDKRIFKRLRVYLLIMIILLVIITFELVQGRFYWPLILWGLFIGFFVGLIVSRMFKLSWDEDSNNIISQIDKVGAIILGCYLVFVFTRTYFLSYVVQGNPLFGLILSLTAGTMLGRIMGTRHSLDKILKALKMEFIKKSS